MKRMLMVSGITIFLCVGLQAFDNYKEAYDSGLKKTEGFGEFEAAREDFNKAISLTSKPAEKADAIFQTGETYYWQENYSQAREEYERIKGMEKIGNAYIAQAQMRIADAYAAEKKYGQARQEYSKILAMDGKIANTATRRFSSLPKVEAQYKIAELYRAEGNYDEAKKEFLKILQLEEATEKDKIEVKYRIKSIYR